MDVGILLRFVIMCTTLTLSLSKCLQEHPLSISCIGEGYDVVPNNLPRNIHTLNLSHNNISYLEADVLRLYSRVTQFNLDYNEISTTNDIKSIAVMEKLKEFHISGNDLRHFDFHVFSYNDHLNKIVANDNAHIALKEKPVYLTNIKSISLQRDRLVNFPLTALKGFSNLEVIDLSGNGLKVIPDNLEDTFGKLEMLILFHNPLKHVEQVLLPKRYLMITSGTEYTDKSRVTKKSVDYYQRDAENLKELKNNNTEIFQSEIVTLHEQNVFFNETEKLGELNLKTVFHSNDSVVVVVGVILVVFLTISVMSYFYVITRTAYKEQQMYQYLNNNA